MFFHLFLSFNCFNYRLTASFSLSAQEKTKLLRSMKGNSKCLRRLPLFLSHITHLWQFQSANRLFDSLPAVISLSSSPLPDPLFPSLAQLGQNVSLPVSSSVSVCLALTVGGKPNLELGINLNS
ncbi:hypothetical protein ILYODFUR_013940 [Ilyodon furcidens]|uniref:Uncharacterized protein n=1 Tax=Ilyodon furcidens TaxID=33524 RepID=A0ABV0SPF8_9TELE